MEFCCPHCGFTYSPAQYILCRGEKKCDACKKTFRDEKWIRVYKEGEQCRLK